MTDNQFLQCTEQMRSGDRQGLHNIYTEYFRLIYADILAVVKNTAAAEDVTQDFFIKLWTLFSSGSGSYDPKKKGHKRWLAVSAHNLAVDHVRRHKNEQLFDFDEEQSGREFAVDGIEEAAASRTDINSALNRLSEAERTVIHLKYYSELTLEEISEVLGIPKGTAAWRCRTACSKLKKYIGEVL